MLLTAALLAVLPALSPVPAAAQGAPPPASPPPAGVSVDDLQRLVDTLENDQDREKLVQQLRTLIAAQRSAAPPAEAPPPTFVGRLSQELDAISGEILATVSVIIDAPRLIAWIEIQAGDEAARARWGEVLLHLLVVFGLAVVAEFAARTLLSRPRQALADRSSEHVTVRIVQTTLRTLLDLLPIAAFAATAYLVLPLVQPRIATARVAEVMIHASVLARALLVLARGVLLTAHAPTTLAGVDTETRTYLYIWSRRFISWSVYGYAVAEGSWWLGVPGGIYATLLKAVALVLAVLAIIFVLQNRQSIGGFIRGKPPAEGPERGKSWRILRHRLADTWHVLAVVYIIGVFAVYALQVPGGFGFLLRATVLSVVLVVGARLLVRLVVRLSERGFAIKPELKSRFPTLERRANRYIPVLSAVASVVIYLFALLALLQAWGVDTFSWFDSSIGRRVTSAAIAIGAVLVVALVAWEMFSSAIERYLAAVDDEGRPMVRSPRARTLLPLLRTTMMIVLAVMVVLIVLSEVGVDIAPLLAGAGIVGLAIGFGSQALVKDIITGLFILIEDTLAVGDVVDVGGDHAGVVEAITVRAIKLRDGTGAIHTVPFSSVTSVKNQTRDFAYYVIDVKVAYREDTDEVIEVLKGVSEELRQDPAFGWLMLAPLEVIGVDRFEPGAVIISIRLKTSAAQQWTVGREFNRRMKKAFDANGISMPSSHHTLYFGADRGDQASPIRIAVESPAPEAKPKAAES
ncbi:MAG TPA: mechanosensitive ion channel domain-containing protein [Stellaceae bacterium]|nr:mechanosensitive ion channel domain-containing protein [Stellaceae bacterium]